MFDRLKNWKEYYALSCTDKRAVADYMECESDEIVRGFQNELIGISQGKFDPAVLDALLGKGRPVKYGSWEEWAKMMLLWMAECRRR